MGWAPATHTWVKIWGMWQYYVWSFHSYCKEELVRDPSNFGCCESSLNSTLEMVWWSDTCRYECSRRGARYPVLTGKPPWLVLRENINSSIAWSALTEDCKRETEHGRWQISEAREEPNAILWNIYLFVLPLIFRWKIIFIVIVTNVWNDRNTQHMLYFWKAIVYTVNRCCQAWPT